MYSKLDLSQSKENEKVPNITLKLDHNPVQCDCDLSEFIKFPKGKLIKGFQ